MERSEIRGLSRRSIRGSAPGLRCAPSGLRRLRRAVWQL